MALLNFVKMTITNTPSNTSQFTLGTAVVPYQSFAAAGAVDGTSYSYVAIDNAKFECGHGTYTAASNSLSRDTIYDCSAGQGIPETLSSNTQVYVSPLKQDMPDINAILGQAFAVAMLF